MTHVGEVESVLTRDGLAHFPGCTDGEVVELLEALGDPIDNTRMLHARTAIGSGARHLRRYWLAKRKTAHGAT